MGGVDFGGGVLLREGWVGREGEGGILFGGLDDLGERTR
jgi:hypothetical protein